MRAQRRLHIVAAAFVVLGGCGGGGSSNGDGGEGGGTVPTPRVPLSDAQATEAATGAGLSLIAALLAAVADPPGLAAPGDAARQALAQAAQAAGTRVCANSGTLRVTCRVDGGRSVLSSRADQCIIEDAANGLELSLDGRLRAVIDAADVCRTGVIPPAARRVERFTYFQANVRRGGVSIETFTASKLMRTVRPLADGCAGAQATLEMHGRLGVRRSDGMDVTVDALPLHVRIVSDGAPCVRRIVGDGRLDVMDRASGRLLHTVVDGLTVASVDGAGFGLDGAAVLDCIGALGFATDQPLILDPPCATSGALRMRLPSGATALSRFDGGALSLDSTGDGVAERVVRSCVDASLAMCR